MEHGNFGGARERTTRGQHNVSARCVWSASDRLDTYIHWGAPQLPLSSLSVHCATDSISSVSGRGAAALFALPPYVRYDLP